MNDDLDWKGTGRKSADVLCSYESVVLARLVLNNPSVHADLLREHLEESLSVVRWTARRVHCADAPTLAASCHAAQEVEAEIVTALVEGFRERLAELVQGLEAQRESSVRELADVAVRETEEYHQGGGSTNCEGRYTHDVLGNRLSDGNQR